MGEVIYTSSGDARAYLERYGFETEGITVVESYPVVHSSRQVMRVRSDRGDRVYKLRPNDEKADTEAGKMHKLIAAYRFQGGHFSDLVTRESQGIKLIDMPYLGIDLRHISSQLDEIDLGYIDPSDAVTKGFSENEITNLVDSLRQNHQKFAARHGIIHGDIFQDGTRSPNNTLFNPSLNQLLLIDAEALGKASFGARRTFEKQIERLEEWMHENLLKPRS